MPSSRTASAKLSAARTFRRALAVGLGLVLALGFAGPVAAESRPVKLLAFGDSLIHGYGLANGDSFPEQLEAALAARGLAVEVINAGNSGDTSAAGRARLDWALADRPDIALVEFGGNDFLRGIDPADTYRNLDSILARLKAEKVTILLAGMRAPANMGPDYVKAFNAVYPRLAGRHNVVLYPFFLEGVALEPALNQADGIHPNAAGVAVIVERIVPDVERLMKGLRAAGGGADG